MTEEARVVADVAAVMAGFWGETLKSYWVRLEAAGAARRLAPLTVAQHAMFEEALCGGITQALQTFRYPLQRDFSVSVDYVPNLLIAQAAAQAGFCAHAYLPIKTGCRWIDGQVQVYDLEAPIWQTGRILYVLLTAQAAYVAEVAAWARCRNRLLW